MPGKSAGESRGLCVPTAGYGQGRGAVNARRVISGRETEAAMCEVGKKSVGVLELTAQPSIDKEYWVPMVREAVVLMVNGGDPMSGLRGTRRCERNRSRLRKVDGSSCDGTRRC